MTKNYQYLEGISEMDDVVEVGTGSTTNAIGIGTLRAKLVAEGVSREMVENNVVFGPALTSN